MFSLGIDPQIYETVDPTTGQVIQQIVQSQVNPATGQTLQTLIPIPSLPNVNTPSACQVVTIQDPVTGQSQQQIVQIPASPLSPTISKDPHMDHNSKLQSNGDLLQKLFFSTA